MITIAIPLGHPDAPVDEQTVVNMTAAVIRQNAATPVLVKADENVPWGRLARGMVLLTQAGAANVGMITDPLELEND